MEIVIRQTPSEVSSTVADIVEGYVRRGPATLGLATGSSPLGSYRELARRHRESGLDFSDARAFLLDEYVGLPKSHDQSYFSVIRSEFVDHVNLDTARVLSPNGESPTSPRKVRGTTQPSPRQAASTCSFSASGPTATSASTSRAPR